MSSHVNQKPGIELRIFHFFGATSYWIASGITDDPDRTLGMSSVLPENRDV